MLYARYGEQLRQAPVPEGVGLLAYAVPLGALFAGGVVLWIFFARVRASQRRVVEDRIAAGASQRRVVVDRIAAPVTPDAELARQLDAELDANPR